MFGSKTSTDNVTKIKKHLNDTTFVHALLCTVVQHQICNMRTSGEPDIS